MIIHRKMISKNMEGQFQNWRWKRLTSEIYMEFVSKGKTTLKVGVPALLYFLQNNLLFLAISKLDAATYQVTYQLKILTTAFFSVTMLGKNLSGVKWFSLVLLAGGVALIQIPNNVGAVDAKSKIWFKMNSDQFTGLLAVFSACFLSGFSGVYFERILKDSQVSVWMRNFQLAFFSIICGVLAVYSYDWNLIAKDGYFQGYNAIVWTVILLQAGGGIVIAYVVKYADNILKGFAVSLSIILSSLFSYWILADFQPSMHFIIGATIVIVSTFLYGY